MLEFETLELELNEPKGITTVYFRRPNNLNAFNYQLVSEFCLALKQISKDKLLKCLIVSGRGKAFSVGGDINEFKSALDPVIFMSKLVAKLHEGITLLKNLEIPTIAAINGVCFGAALGYSCACEIRFCTEDAKFGSAFSGIGLPPDSSTSFYLPKIVGLSLASEMIYLNRILNSKEALLFGLVSSVLPTNDDFIEEIKHVAIQLSSGPTFAFKNVKKLLNRSYTNDLTTHLQMEADSIKECAGTEDFKEGITAFLEKRKPNYKGK